LRTEKTIKKIEIEKQMDIVMKDRDILFSYISNERLQTAAWRRNMAHIGANTKKMMQLRKQWRLVNNS
tara:strand:+ start:180 stop:383 length:204 start_codon:yes stop_codon:yes gene_type:complete